MKQNQVKIQKAQGGISVPKTKSSEVKEHTARTEYTLSPEMLARKDTADEIAAAREARIKASIEARKTKWTRNNWREKLALETSATGDKLSLQQLPGVGKYIPNVLDATAGIGHMASAIGAAPLNAQKSNSIAPYLTAVAAPLLVGAVGGIGEKTTGQFVNNMINPVAGMLPTYAIKRMIVKKFIPNMRTRVLPDKLVPEVNLLPESDMKHRIKVMLNDKKGKNYGYLDLEQKPNWARTENGQLAIDENYMPYKNKTEWMRPMNIHVVKPLRGKKAQDVLYQMGIDESKKQGFKGVFSGEDLIAPQNTIKAHKRFNREVLGSKNSLDAPNNRYITHDLVGLTGHTNPNVVTDWMKNYKNIDKFAPRKYSSARDVANKVSPYTSKLPSVDVATPLAAGIIYNASNTRRYQIGGALGAGHFKTTTGKIVVWGTPEYREAYNRGEVVTDKGVRSPVTMQGQKLKEVVIKNNYKRNVLEEYKDKIIEESKDAGVLGAAVGVPISAVMSIPQLLATKLVTGKMQRPSEAMGVQNPWGAAAINIVTDPLTYAGTGLITKGKVFSVIPKIIRGKSVRSMSVPVNTRSAAYNILDKEVEHLNEFSAGMAVKNNNIKNEVMKLGRQLKAKEIPMSEYISKLKLLDENKHADNLFNINKKIRGLTTKRDIVDAQQMNILKSKSQLGKNISDGGSNSSGVFEVSDNFVAREGRWGYNDDANLLLNYANKIKSPRIARTLQVKEMDGKVYQVQEKAVGTPVPKMSEQELAAVPQLHVENFWKDKKY